MLRLGPGGCFIILQKKKKKEDKWNMTGKMLIINEPGWLVQGSSLYYSLYFCNMFEIFNNKKLDISMHDKSTFMNFIKIHLRCIFLSLFSNQRKITLQCCVGFRHTKMYISHKCTNVTSLLNLPTHPPISPLCVITEHQVELPVLYSDFHYHIFIW